MGDTERHARLVDELTEIWNEKNLDLVDERFAEGFEGHMIGEERDLHGRDGYRQWVAETYEMFPDLELTFDPVFVADDVVCGHWTFTGTHEGEIPEFGLAPTGNGVEFSGLFIDRIEDGRVVEMWHQMDTVGLMRQLDAIPEEATGPA